MLGHHFEPYLLRISWRFLFYLQKSLKVAGDQYTPRNQKLRAWNRETSSSQPERSSWNWISWWSNQGDDGRSNVSPWIFWEERYWKLTCPLKRDYFNRKYIFQPSIPQVPCYFSRLYLKSNQAFPLICLVNCQPFPGTAAAVPTRSPPWESRLPTSLAKANGWMDINSMDIPSDLWYPFIVSIVWYDSYVQVPNQKNPCSSCSSD